VNNHSNWKIEKKTVEREVLDKSFDRLMTLGSVSGWMGDRLRMSKVSRR